MDSNKALLVFLGLMVIVVLAIHAQHGKKEFLRGLSLILILCLVLGSIAFVAWSVKPYYTAEDVAWTVSDKYWKQGFALPRGAASGPSYFLVIEYSDEDGIKQKKFSVEKEVWSEWRIGDVFMYPEYQITNWGHYVKGIDPKTAE